jgi:hypothetical protein
MRVVNLVGIALITLSSCTDRTPDMKYVIGAKNNTAFVTLKIFQPQGTIGGKIVLFFSHKEKTDTKTVTIESLKNGNFGWIDNNTFAVVVDKARFHDVSDSYFPDGTIDTELRMIFCSRDKMDCSSVDSRIGNNEKSIRIANFPLQ